MQYSLEIVVWKKCRSVASLLQYSLRRVTRFWKTEGVVFLWKGHKHSGTFLWNAQRYFTIVCSMDAMFIYLYIYIYVESVLIAVTIKKRFSLYFGRTLVWVFSFVRKIVLFGVFPRAKNRALDRAFWCSPPCTKSCFLVLSLVPKNVLFGALPRAKNRALDRAFWCSPSCQKSCFLVLSFVHCSPLSKHRALDRAFWCSPSCTKSCFLVLSFVPKIVL